MHNNGINVAWVKCIIAAIIITCLLYIAKPTLSLVWTIVPSVTTIACGLALAKKSFKTVEQAIELIFNVFITCLISSCLYTLIFVPQSMHSAYKKAVVVSITDTVVEEELIAPEPVEVQPFTTPQQLKKEMHNDSNICFTPINGIERLYSIFITEKSNIKAIDDIEEKIQLTYHTVQYMMDSNMGTIKNDNFDELNGNKTYTNLLRKANDDEELLKIKGESIDLYNQIINNREQAFEIGKTRALALLLARDYYEFGKFHYELENKQEAFNWYTKSIDYYNIAIKLTKLDESYKNDKKDVFYRIGQVYHSIGDIQYIDKETRKNAYFMALTYLKLSCDREHDQFYSDYYSGMVAHKLGIILDKSRNLLLNDAIKYYEKCLDSTKKISTRLSLYQFSEDVYVELIQYTRKYGQKEKNKMIDEYTKKIQATSDCIKSLKNTL